MRRPKWIFEKKAFERLPENDVPAEDTRAFVHALVDEWSIRSLQNILWDSGINEHESELFNAIEKDMCGDFVAELFDKLDFGIEFEDEPEEYEQITYNNTLYDYESELHFYEEAITHYVFFKVYSIEQLQSLLEMMKKGLRPEFYDIYIEKSFLDDYIRRGETHLNPAIKNIIDKYFSVDRWNDRHECTPV